MIQSLQAIKSIHCIPDVGPCGPPPFRFPSVDILPFHFIVIAQ